jgi:hypothetical protein
LSRLENNAASQDRWVWVTALAVMLTIQIASTIHHQRGVYDNYRSRLATPPDVLLAAEPIVDGDQVDFIAMRADGYRVNTTASTGNPNEGTTDQFSHTRLAATTWIEEAGTGKPTQIVRLGPKESTRMEVADAESPVVSGDGNALAFLRSDHGANSVWLRSLREPKRSDIRITPSGLDVEEVTFLPDGSVIFAAMKPEQPSELYVAKLNGAIQSLAVTNARYPAASADGRWLAYSELDRGVWNLWLRDLHNGATRRLTDAACNDISPVWQPDSKTMVYASDCGRALWFTALNRKQVVF